MSAIVGPVAQLRTWLAWALIGYYRFQGLARQQQIICGTVTADWGLRMAAAPQGSFSRRPWSPWKVPDPYGSPAALRSAGSVAAPLLAGFCFTLVALVLTSPERIRWPDATLLLLTAAGLSLIAAVQCSAWAGRWDISPTEILSWWPDFTQLPQEAREYLFKEQQTHAEHYVRWARATRLAYNGGILSLLAGVTVLLSPPDHESIVSLRGLALLLGLIGFFAELAWVVVSEFL